MSTKEVKTKHQIRKNHYDSEGGLHLNNDWVLSAMEEYAEECVRIALEGQKGPVWVKDNFKITEPHYDDVKVYRIDFTDSRDNFSVAIGPTTPKATLYAKNGLFSASDLYNLGQFLIETAKKINNE